IINRCDFETFFSSEYTEMAYIKPHLLPNLYKYKYAASDKSPIANYILQPFWSWLVTLFPLWMAPNLITLLGFSCIIFNVACFFLVSGDLNVPCPNWMYLTFGIGLFTYQALDAIDGKQARRTGTSSPLGQLFDHGCDALNTSLGAVLAISAMDLGTSNWALLSVMATTLNFFLTTWEEYYTGVLYLGYINGPVEGVLFLVMVFIVSFFFGPGIWSQNVFPEVQMIIEKIPYVSSWLLNGSVMKWNELFVLTMLIPVVGSLIVSLFNVYGAVRAQGKSFISTFLGLIPMLTCLTLSYIILQKYPFIQEKYLAEFILATGMASANMVGRLIVAHVVHDDIPLYTPYYLILGAIAFINLEAHLSHVQIIYTLLSVSVAVHSHFCFSVMSQISNYMSIRVFHVTKKSKKNTN
ncbi:hypothetical protein MP638_002891, partial [Amoeboaphelidium occidentale]